MSRSAEGDQRYQNGAGRSGNRARQMTATRVSENRIRLMSPNEARSESPASLTDFSTCRFCAPTRNPGRLSRRLSESKEQVLPCSNECRYPGDDSFPPL